MGLRFSKRLKIFPGVRLNIGLTGSSLSIGPRGASVNFGKRGTYGNLGIPGSGLSFRTRLDGGGRRPPTPCPGPGRASAPPPSGPTAAEIAEQDALAATLDLDDDGELSILDRFDRPLEGRASRAFWEHRGREVRDLLERFCAQHDQQFQAIDTVHHETPPPVFTAIYTANPFPEPMPAGPQERLSWQVRKHAHDREQQFISTNFKKLVCNNGGFMEQALEDVLGTVEWPLETLLSYQVRQDCLGVDFDVDMPEIEDLPSHRYQLAASGRRLLKQAITAGETAGMYARYVHGIALRIAGMAFAVLPEIDVATISGYTQRIDPATGRENDEYVLSVRVRRPEIERLDFQRLEHIDPVDALTGWELRRQFRGSKLAGIEPFAAASP